MRANGTSFGGHAATVSIAIVLAVATVVGSLALGDALPVKGSRYELQTVAPTSAFLKPGSRVTMAGVPVGEVTDIEPRGLSTVMTVAISDDRVVPVPRDTRVAVKQRTAVGENYLALERGRSKVTVPSGGLLPISRSDEYVDVDQILSVLDGPMRERMRSLLQSTGAALDTRGDELNRVVADTSGALQAGSKLFTVLDQDREHVAGAVARLGSVMDAVGERRATVRELARGALQSMQAVADRDRALERTLAVLPSTLGQVRRTSTTLGSVTSTAAPVVRRLAVAADDLEPAITRLGPASDEGRKLLAEVSRAAGPLGTTLRRATTLAPPLVKALPALRSALCEANPAIRYLKPYTDDLVQMIIGLGSAANAYDAIGHVIRLTPIVSESSLVGLPPEVSGAAHTLLRSGLLAKTSGLTLIPYPKAGRVGKDAAAPGDTVPTTDALRKTYKYPRVMPDC